ncbi:MAG: sporulation protein YqfC [Defluviitaleaceae bacterium]|nr:sporulation protein YqfC [Defluviitaleaceae bacterium]
MKKYIPDKFKYKVVKALELPKEIVLDLPSLSMIGNEELSVENYKSIIEYKPELLRLNTKTGILYIEGKNLCLKQVTPDQIRITGCILNIKYGGF